MEKNKKEKRKTEMFNVLISEVRGIWNFEPPGEGIRRGGRWQWTSLFFRLRWFRWLRWSRQSRWPRWRQLIPESGEGREWRGAGGWLPPSVAREREAWRREPPFHATGLPPTDATVCSRSPNLPRSETKILIFYQLFVKPAQPRLLFVNKNYTTRFPG